MNGLKKYTLSSAVNIFLNSCIAYSRSQSHASRDVIIDFVFAARTARCEGRPWYPERAERAANCGAVPAARRIIFI